MQESETITKRIVTWSTSITVPFESVKKLMVDDKILNKEMDDYITKLHETNSSLPKSKKVEIFHREKNVLVTEKEYIFCLFDDMV